MAGGSTQRVSEHFPVGSRDVQVLPGSPYDQRTIMPLDRSADDRVILGYRKTESATTAIVGDAQHEMRHLTEVLLRHQASSAGWHLLSASVISDEGMFIAGEGIDPTGEPWLFLATLPPQVFGTYAESRDHSPVSSNLPDTRSPRPLEHH